MTAMVEVDILRHVLGGADGEGGAVSGITVTCFPVMSFTTAVVDLAAFSAEFFLWLEKRTCRRRPWCRPFAKSKGWGTRSRKADS